MKVYVCSYWNKYATDGYEWTIDPDAIFLSEDDAKAHCEREQAKMVEALVEERNRHEQERYRTNLRYWREDVALRAAGIRTGGTAMVEPKAPEIFTEPQWKPRACFTYEEYEAR